MSEGFQNMVLFNEFPRLNSTALRSYIVGLEPDADEVCEVSEFLMKANDSGSVASGVITYGNLHVAIMIYGHAAPDASLHATVDVSLMPEEDRIKIRAHRVYALCTCLGGDDYQPVESIILLLKVGIALVEQGAIAVANEHNCTCYPADFMKDLAEQASSGLVMDEAEDLDDPEDRIVLNLWESLRDEGMPAELLAGFLPADVDGEIWFLSAGHALYGFPELAYNARNLDEIDDMEQHFREIFYYMFENGPILSAGQSVAFEDNASYHFAELPPEHKDMEGACGTLLVTLETTE